MFWKRGTQAFLLLLPFTPTVRSAVIQQITATSSSACQEINNGSGGVNCTPLPGADNLTLQTNPTPLPGTVTFESSDDSSFTYTQADQNPGYLFLQWTAQLSERIYQGAMPFDYSFTITENDPQALNYLLSFGGGGAITSSASNSTDIDGALTQTVTGQGMAFHAIDSDLVHLGLGVSFQNLFPLDVPIGDEFTVSDVTVNIDIPPDAFLPEPAPWQLLSVLALVVGIAARVSPALKAWRRRRVIA
jgi:hypothetical protein